MTYEERQEAIAEEKNEHKQVERHFEDLYRERLEEQLSDALTQLEEVKANADYQIEGRELEIKELREQIEKMKCGQNCKHSYLYQEDRKCKFTYCDCINCKDKWELKE